jgi:dUTPase
MIPYLDAEQLTTDSSGKKETSNLLKTEKIEDDKEIKYIKIPKKKTAIVWTNESILLKDYFCGSIHSKVKWVSLGIGHIGTRVNPNYGGVLAIALHNYSDEVVEINVGDTIAYLMIHRLSSKSSFSQTRDDPGKLIDAIPSGYSVSGLDKKRLDLGDWLNSENEWRKGIEEKLSGKLNEPDRQGINELQKAKHALENYENERKGEIQRSLESRVKSVKKWDSMTWISLFTLCVALPPFIDWITRLISKE